jgi:hypothetical protein
MNSIDYLNLDRNALKTFLTALEESSVSRVGENLRAVPGQFLRGLNDRFRLSPE